MEVDLAAYVARMTERLLVDSGIGPGLSVVDAGCGRGDVSFLLARLVGKTGRVLGLDRDPEALAQAGKRAGELGLTNVTFTRGDINDLSIGQGCFDAVADRRVLMYQPDPARTLGQLAQAGLDVEHVRAEAVVQTPETRYATGAIIRAMMPRISRLGVATEQEIDVDTLDQRLDAERREAEATYIGELVFGAWARKPQPAIQGGASAPPRARSRLSS